MIENRLRLERQIYLGRQEVRRAQQGRIKNTTPLPPTTNGQPRHMLVEVESASTDPAHTDPEMPLSLDTDAEAAYADDTRWFYRRGNGNGTPSPATSGASTAKEDTPQSQSQKSRKDSLRSPITRRKWASNHTHSQSANEEGDGDSEKGIIDDPSTSAPKAGSSSNSTVRVRTESGGGSFFHRLRKQSIGNLSMPSPFSTLRRKSSSSVHAVTPTAEQVFSAHPDPAWSSDSSSGDDLSLEEQRYLHHPTAIYARTPSDWQGDEGLGQDRQSEAGEDDGF